MKGGKKPTDPLQFVSTITDATCALADVHYSRHMSLRVKPLDAWNLIKAGSVLVVDVRGLEEWATGHLPGARAVPLDQLRANPAAVLPRKGVIFVCAGGVRSETAARLAEQHGITDVYSITGGTQSWIKAGLPIATELSVAV